MGVLKNLKHNEAFNGILLIFVTMIALIIQNSPLSEYYNSILITPIGLNIGEMAINKPFILWINDGLMTFFFFYVGLEIKKEIIEGHLSTRKQIILPTIGAIGGILIPALIFIAFNNGNEFNMKGWAIPTATDIAFALGILALLGRRVPLSLKVFLLALAIIDDLGAILIIAFFYTNELNNVAIIISSILITSLIFVNKFKVEKLSVYIVLGAILWISILESGFHPTITGVIVALLIPLYNKSTPNKSMVKDILKDMHVWVYMIILPVFAFANAGIKITGVSYEDLIHPVSLGIFFGLVLGKPIGVFILSYLAIKLKIADMPKNANFKMILGVSILTGVGFTMSVFINGLAYNETDVFNFVDKLSILIASGISALIGYFYLLTITKKEEEF